MTAPRFRNRSVYALAAANVLLAALAVQGARMEPDLPDANELGETADDGVLPTEIAGLDKTHGSIDEYKAVIERPLFDATRRPPPPPEAANTNASGKMPKLPEYTLDGVVIVAGQRTALLKNKATSKVTRATEGMQLGDWRLKTLEANRVVLGHRDNEHEISLWNFGAAATPAAARSPPQPRQQPAHRSATE